MAKYQVLVVAFAFAAALTFVTGATINHDLVQPFDQPEPATISEKAAVKFNPKLYIIDGCASYPAVNGAGESSGGLKGTKGVSGCKGSGYDSQVYGRGGWYNDRWAIMYAWYFPKGFWDGNPWWRHDWANVILPALDSPTILVMSKSITENKYDKDSSMEAVENGTTPHLGHEAVETAAVRMVEVVRTPRQLLRTQMIRYSTPIHRGEFHPLIMWEQLTEEARTALNGGAFGRTEVPMSDAKFDKHLDEAWPF